MLSRTLDSDRRAAQQSPLGRTASVVALLCLVPAGFYYALLLSCTSSSFFASVPHGLTFNSMLLHLLHGSFDVDPQTIGDEGSLRNGLIYTYFGPLPALLRLVFLPLANFATTDFTRLSCLTAVSVMAAFKMMSVLTVWRATGTRDRSILLTLFSIAILVSGPQIQFLRALIYQEVILWSGALAAAFVFVALRGYYSNRGITRGILIALATIAGLCLLTRVSTALGLYIAVGLLWLPRAWHRARAAEPIRTRLAALAVFATPIAIACGFAAVAGFINYQRWGNPLLFGDPHHYLWAMLHAPDRLPRVEKYGDFNFIRLGYGLIYYFCPVWALRGGDGNLLWSAFQQRTIDTVELPPSSFFVSDPLIVGLAVYALVQFFRHRDRFKPGIAIPMLFGLLVPAVLMLIAICMAFRYRMEFYPFFEFCAFIGFGALLSRRAAPPVVPFAAATLVGILAAHILWVLYMLTPFGTASAVLGGSDVSSFYRAMLHL